MKINPTTQEYLTIELEKDIDFGKGIIVKVPGNKQVTIHLATRELAIVHFTTNKPSEFYEDSYVVGEKQLERYNQGDA